MLGYWKRYWVLLYIGIQLYQFRPTDGSFNVVGNDYLNPVQLLDSYNDYTNTSKLLGSINTTWKITSKLKYQFLFGVESSNSTRKSQLLPTIEISGAQFAQATDPADKCK